MKKKAAPNDIADAEAVLAIVRAVRPFWETRPAACGQMVRHALDRFWDAPRSAKQGHRNRPSGALWSPAAVQVARQAQEDQAGSGKRSDLWKTLVGEHVVPAKLQVQSLVELEKRGASIEEIIQAAMPHFAIVTHGEDEALRRAGLRDKMPEGWTWGDDVWARYRAAGLEPDTFVLWMEAPQSVVSRFDDQAGGVDPA